MTAIIDTNCAYSFALKKFQALYFFCPVRASECLIYICQSLCKVVTSQRDMGTKAIGGSQNRHEGPIKRQASKYRIK